MSTSDPSPHSTKDKSVAWHSSSTAFFAKCTYNLNQHFNPLMPVQYQPSFQSTDLHNTIEHIKLSSTNSVNMKNKPECEHKLGARIKNVFLDLTD